MLPSKRIQVALLLLVVGIAGLIYYNYNKDSVVVYESPKKDLVVSTSSFRLINNLTETGNDNAITNTQQPNDTVDSSILTATDVFARDFFTEFLKKNEEGVEITADNAEEFITDYVKTAPLPTINKQTYSLKDLDIISPTVANLRNYQSNITSVFTRNWPSGDAQNEMLIMSESLSNDNPTALDSLTKVISIYKNGSIANGRPVSTTSSSTKINMSGMSIIEMATNDYVEVYAKISATDTINVYGLNLNAIVAGA
jgi:hypothetical protein